MLPPFVLSLSKHCPSLSAGVRAADEGQPFDKLRANGWVPTGRRQTCRPPGKVLPPAPAIPRAGRHHSHLARALLQQPRNHAGKAMSGNSIFGIHGAALEVRAQRMGVLASNIANASTPGFKARDIDFRQALASAGSAQGSVDQGIEAAMKFRVPNQPSMDGNTVELSQEQTAFAENAVQYQTTLSFLNGRISTLTRALRGE
jgi:flagellar basal-body rod protein FlgB